MQFTIAEDKAIWKYVVDSARTGNGDPEDINWKDMHERTGSKRHPSSLKRRFMQILLPCLFTTEFLPWTTKLKFGKLFKVPVSRGVLKKLREKSVVLVDSVGIITHFEKRDAFTPLDTSSLNGKEVSLLIKINKENAKALKRRIAQMMAPHPEDTVQIATTMNDETLETADRDVTGEFKTPKRENPKSMRMFFDSLEGSLLNSNQSHVESLRETDSKRSSIPKEEEMEETSSTSGIVVPAAKVFQELQEAVNRLGSNHPKLNNISENMDEFVRKSRKKNIPIAKVRLAIQTALHVLAPGSSLSSE